VLKQRIFIGLSVNNWISGIEDIQHQLDTILKKYPINIQWQKPESLHLTLIFVGEVDLTTTQQIYDILSSNITQNFYHSFMLKAEKLFLLNHRHLVLNVVSPKLLEIQKKIQDVLAQENIIQPEYNFHAHITIGKIVDIKNSEQHIILETIEKTKNMIIQWPKIKISDINLYESHPKKKYVCLKNFQLI